MLFTGEIWPKFETHSHCEPKNILKMASQTYSTVFQHIDGGPSLRGSVAAKLKDNLELAHGQKNRLQVKKWNTHKSTRIPYKPKEAFSNIPNKEMWGNHFLHSNVFIDKGLMYNNTMF